MSTLWEKLTGKAPLVENKDDAAQAGGTENGAENKAEKKRIRKARREEDKQMGTMRARKKDYSFLKVILKWMIPIGICLALLIASKFVDGFMNNAARARIAEQVTVHGENQNKIITAQDDINAAQEQLKQDEGRMVFAGKPHDEDDAVAASFFGKYMTWSSGEEYEALREEFMLVAPDSPTAQECLFPKQWSYQDPDTLDIISYIDTEHMNLKFDRLEAYRTGASLETSGVSYAAIVLATRDADAFGSKSERLAFYAEYEIANGGIKLGRMYSLTGMEEY